MVVTVRNATPDDPSRSNPAGSPRRADAYRFYKDSIEALVAFVLLCSAAVGALWKFQEKAGWYGAGALCGLIVGVGGIIAWRRFSAPRRKALALTLTVIGLATFGLSTWQAWQGGPARKSVSKGPQPSAAPTPSPSGTVPSVKPTVSPHRSGKDRTEATRDEGQLAAPTSSSADGRGKVTPTTSTPSTPAHSTTRPPAKGSLTITFPRDGDNPTADQRVNGFATLPPEHKIVLLWERESSGQYYVQGACESRPAWFCGSPYSAMDRGQGVYWVHVVMVDPATASGLRPGTLLTKLPSGAGHHKVWIKGGDD